MPANALWQLVDINGPFAHCLSTEFKSLYLGLDFMGSCKVSKDSLRVPSHPPLVSAVLETFRGSLTEVRMSVHERYWSKVFAKQVTRHCAGLT